MSTAVATHALDGSRHPDRRATALAAGAVGGLTLAAISAVIAADGAVAHPGATALARALTVGTPIAVGLYAWQRRPAERFGALLVGAGVLWFFTTFSESSLSLPYSVGRVAGWAAELLIAILFLAYPTGRLRTTVDRRLALATGLLVAVLFAPTALFVHQYPLPATYTSCSENCPANAFEVFHPPAFIAGVIIPVREVLLLALVAAIVARLGQRLHEGTPLMRRALAPVLAAGIIRISLLGAAVAARSVGATEVTETLAMLLALALPVVALAFLLGLLRARLEVARMLETLSARLRISRSPSALRLAFAEAFGDPSVRIAFPPRLPGAPWIDAAGAPVAMPEPGDGRCATEIRDDGEAVAAIVHDEALREQRAVVEAGGGLALMLLDNQRLAARVEESSRELRRSRDRVVAGADRERRRLERDLHDGAQQRLVALRIELGLASELVGGAPDVLSARLEQMAEEVDEALDDIRSLAHGVYPALLADRGLVDALRPAVRRSPVPARIETDPLPRFAPEIESALYFCALEALQNVAKHATGATGVVVRIAEEDGVLEVSVRDDGAGAEAGTLDGTGIENMRDRVVAVGGTLEVASAPGVGTVVCARVPAR